MYFIINRNINLVEILLDQIIHIGIIILQFYAAVNIPMNSVGFFAPTITVEKL